MRVGVVGGGIIGAAVARELARRGAEVQIFEGRSIAAGATQASAGALVPFVEAHEPGPLRHLTVRSLAMYDDFVAAASKDSGHSIDYARCGSIEVALDGEEAARLKLLAASAPVDGVRWLNSADLRLLQPSLGDEAVGGVLIPTHGYVAASELTRALVVAAINEGARLRHASVARVRGEADSATIEDGAGETFVFDRVVLAAGSWVSRLRLDGFAAPPVRPVKGQLLRARCSGGSVPRILWSSACYVVPQSDGDVLIGATMEEVGFDEAVTEEGAEGLRRGFSRLLPRLAPEVVSHRAGLRPATPDNLPIVGVSSAAPAVLYAVGHFRNGIVLAPLTAGLVTGQILGDVPDPAAAVLGAARFGL